MKTAAVRDYRVDNFGSDDLGAGEGKHFLSIEPGIQKVFTNVLFLITGKRKWNEKQYLQKIKHLDRLYENPILKLERHRMSTLFGRWIHQIEAEYDMAVIQKASPTVTSRLRILKDTLKEVKKGIL